MNSTYKIIIPLLSAVILFSACKRRKAETPDIPENAGGNQLAVIITPNTAMRVDPLIFSSRVEQLKKGEVGEILEKTSELKTVGAAKNYWYKIKIRNGISGWVFGANINVLKNSSKDGVESYLSKFWEKETDELRNALQGKWWSINRFNDFTNHCLEIYSDGKYKSYVKGSTKKIEGEYNFDFNRNLVIFLGGTSFEGDLNYTRRGDIYTLSRETAKDEIRFKLINVNPESEVEDSKLKSAEDNADAGSKGNEDQN